MVKDSKSGLERLRRASSTTTIGRPAGDPDDIRSDRLTLRIHPDLMSVLMQRSREAGVTRSLYVEKILIDYVNAHEDADLDAIGRLRDLGAESLDGKLGQKKPPLAIHRQRSDEEHARDHEMTQASLARRSSQPTKPRLPGVPAKRR